MKRRRYWLVLGLLRTRVRSPVLENLAFSAIAL